jgi:ABC-type glycerol-3-phosphate transport system substrate-binding protein
MDNWKTADGQMGGLPSLMNTYGVWYNADAFTAAGLPLPKAGWTWDEMYADAAKLANKNGAKYGLVADQLTSPDGPFTMSMYAVSAGGAPFTDNVNHPTKAEADDKYTEASRSSSPRSRTDRSRRPGTTPRTCSRCSRPARCR